MYNKIVASFMTALMAAMVLVSPALGATALNTYPTFLGKAGDFYVVVGSKAAASDVAGAIDVASNLAQLSYSTTSVGSTTSSTGTTDRKVLIPWSSSGGQIGGSTSNQVPSTLKTFHYTGLLTGQFSYRGTNHNYHEQVTLPTSGTALSLTHSISSPINGTLKMRIDGNSLYYQYVFDDAIAVTDFISTGSSGNTTSGMNTYQNPVSVTVAGQQLLITAVPSTTQFVALVGSVKTLSDGESLTAGDLTFKVVQSFSSTTAKIEITDPSGNVLKSGINTGSSESTSYGGSTYNYKVLSSGATASGVPGYAQLLAGKGDIEKTFDGSTTATLSAFGSSWKVSGVFATAGQITANDYIKVLYNPESLTDDGRYFLPGATFQGPNKYFELNYAGLTPSNFATVSISPVSGQTIYDSTISTGYHTVGSLSGLKIATDVAGTLVYGGTGYNEVYVLFNASSAVGNATTTSFTNSTGYWLAYKDTTTSKIVTLSNTSFNVGGTPVVYNFTADGGSAWVITLSYGGPGAQQTFTLGGLASASAQAPTLFNVNLNASIAGTSTQISTFAFQNKTTPSQTSAPDLRLGATTSTADSNDVKVLIENSLQDISTQSGTVISDNGTQVVTVKSNVEADKVVLNIPPEVNYGLIKFGKTGAATTTSGSTVNVVVPITAAVAKLDSEVTAADKAGKDLVLVGGPCANTLVADLKTAGKLAHGCTDWPARNFGLIQVVDDSPSTGHQTVVVAGTRAEDTRLASSVLQNYATKLSSITASKVEVSGTALASATVTPA